VTGRVPAPPGRPASGDDLLAIAERLAAVGARDEVLGIYTPPGRMLGLLPRPARIRPVGRVWRLGAFLLTPTGQLLHTGRVIRVAGTDRRRSVVADAITEHHELALAARRGGCREGDTVNFEARPCAPGEAGVADLCAYLAERAELLIHPLPGA